MNIVRLSRGGRLRLLFACALLPSLVLPVPAHAAPAAFAGVCTVGGSLNFTPSISVVPVISVVNVQVSITGTCVYNNNTGATIAISGTLQSKTPTFSCNSGVLGGALNVSTNGYAGAPTFTVSNDGGSMTVAAASTDGRIALAGQLVANPPNPCPSGGATGWSGALFVEDPTLD